MKEDSLFCRYCPCIGCDGNAAGNKVATGYEDIPDPEHCMGVFAQEDTPISWNTFLRAVFELHGSTVNTDWHRWLLPEEETGNGCN